MVNRYILGFAALGSLQQHAEAQTSKQFTIDSVPDTGVKIAVQSTVESNLNSLVVGNVQGYGGTINQSIEGTGKWPTQLAAYDRFTIEAHSAGSIQATKESTYVNGAFAFSSNGDVTRNLTFGTGTGAGADSDNGNTSSARVWKHSGLNNNVGGISSVGQNTAAISASVQSMFMLRKTGQTFQDFHRVAFHNFGYNTKAGSVGSALMSGTFDQTAGSAENNIYYDATTSNNNWGVCVGQVINGRSSQTADKEDTDTGKQCTTAGSGDANFIQIDGKHGFLANLFTVASRGSSKQVLANNSHFVFRHKFTVTSASNKKRANDIDVTTSDNIVKPFKEDTEFLDIKKIQFNGCKTSFEFDFTPGKSFNHGKLIKSQTSTGGSGDNRPRVVSNLQGRQSTIKFNALRGQGSSANDVIYIDTVLPAAAFANVHLKFPYSANVLPFVTKNAYITEGTGSPPQVQQSGDNGATQAECKLFLPSHHIYRLTFQDQTNCTNRVAKAASKSDFLVPERCYAKDSTTSPFYVYRTNTTGKVARTLLGTTSSSTCCSTLSTSDTTQNINSGNSNAAAKKLQDDGACVKKIVSSSDTEFARYYRPGSVKIGNAYDIPTTPNASTKTCNDYNPADNTSKHLLIIQYKDKAKCDAAKAAGKTQTDSDIQKKWYVKLDHCIQEDASVRYRVKYEYDSATKEVTKRKYYDCGCKTQGVALDDWKAKADTNVCKKEGSDAKTHMYFLHSNENAKGGAQRAIHAHAKCPLKCRKEVANTANFTSGKAPQGNSFAPTCATFTGIDTTCANASEQCYYMEGHNAQGDKKRWRLGMGCLAGNLTSQQLTTKLNEYKGTGKLPGSTTNKSTPTQVVKCGPNDDCHSSQLCSVETAKACPKPKDYNKINKDGCDALKWSEKSFKAYTLDTTGASVNPNTWEYCAGSSYSCAVLVTGDKTDKETRYPMGCQKKSTLQATCTALKNHAKYKGLEKFVCQECTDKKCECLKPSAAAGAYGASFAALSTLIMAYLFSIF